MNIPTMIMGDPLGAHCFFGQLKLSLSSKKQFCRLFVYLQLNFFIKASDVHFFYMFKINDKDNLKR